ncbi:MAG TPA: hypothetical protein VHE30_12170 [Polyangiaceae bacterium]|nr:hypothetical protein [Polyangiaceae bacterium]
MSRRSVRGKPKGVVGHSIFRAFAIVSLASVLYPACSVDETHAAGLAQACHLNTDCDTGLVCSAGLCHASCEGSRDCPTGASCVHTAEGNVCELPGDPDGGAPVNTGGDTGSGGAGPGGRSSGGAKGSGGGAATGGESGTGGETAAGGQGNGGSGTGGNPSTGGQNGTGGSVGNAPWNAGNVGACQAGVPAEGQPADVSTPTTVVGDGTKASCTYAVLAAAVAKGGIITFDCGPDPVTISVTSTLNVPTNEDTVIDGGRLVTLDGNGTTRILSFDSGNWQANEHRLTLQHLALQNGKTTPQEAIPPAPAPCSQGYNDGQGGAVYMRDGNLTVVDCIFTNNRAADLGPDTGGGAIYVQGSKHGTVIAGSSFIGNEAANGGGLGGLFCEHHVYDSLFRDNVATGNGANNNDPNQCSAMNNGQNEIGSGGNGGGLYSDGVDVNIVLCGDEIVNNQAGTGAFGGGLFFTSNNFAGTLTMTDVTMTGNTGGHWTNVSQGSVTNAGTAVGTNCKQIFLSNSTLQGVP